MWWSAWWMLVGSTLFLLRIGTWHWQVWWRRQGNAVQAILLQPYDGAADDRWRHPRGVPHAEPYWQSWHLLGPLLLYDGTEQQHTCGNTRHYDGLISPPYRFCARFCRHSLTIQTSCVCPHVPHRVCYLRSTVTHSYGCCTEWSHLRANRRGATHVFMGMLVVAQQYWLTDRSKQSIY